MKLLWFVQQNSAKIFYAALLTSLASGISNAALIAIISQQFIEGMALTTHFVLIFSVVVFSAITIDLVTKSLLNHLISNTTYALRIRLVNQFLATSFVRLETIGNPRLLAILTDDTKNIAQALSSLPTITISLSTVFGCLAYLLWLSPLTLTAIVLLAIPTIILYVAIQRRANRSLRQSLQERDRLFEHYRTLTEGIKELLLHALRRQAFLDKQFEPSLQIAKQRAFVSRQWLYLAQTVNQFAFFIFLLVLFGVNRWLAIPLDWLSAYALVILYLKSSTMTMVSSLPQWHEAAVTMQKIEAMGFSLSGSLSVNVPSLSFAPNVITADTALLAETTHIELHNICYEYHNEAEESHFQIGPLNLCLRSGEIIFVAGGNGSGKTTLIKLLTGLYTPEMGKIVWNNVVVTAKNLEAYRQNFSTVFVEPFIFDRLLGVEKGKLDNQTHGYLQQLQLSHKVQIADDQLSTINLSHGQRKRLALLTAWLEDRPVYIFDEWAAGQDPEFREIFYHQFLPALQQRGKLVVAITHDEQYFGVANRLIRLDYGQIIQG